MEHVEAQLDAAKEREEMTEKQPDSPAFCWATELAMTQQPVTLSVTEAREVSAEMQLLHSELETLRAGYAAARLEIESLQARIKAMAEEHADELMVAHLDGRMRAAQPAGAQQPGAVYAALADKLVRGSVACGSDGEWVSVRRHIRDEVAEALAASRGQAPAQAAPAAVSGPSDDLVTRESAMQAIEHLAISNSPGREDDAIAMLAAAPTQAQAVAIPLTDREIELIDGMIQVQLDHASRCDAIANRSMADKQKGWDMERVALLQKFKAHGTKGGQHGTE